MSKSWENVKILKEKYLKEDEKLMKMYLPIINPKPNNGYCVFIFDPSDIPTIYRNEGKYPTRYS